MKQVVIATGHGEHADDGRELGRPGAECFVVAAPGGRPRRAVVSLVAYLALPADTGHVSGTSGRTGAAGRRAASLRWPHGLRRRVIGMLLCQVIATAKRHAGNSRRSMRRRVVVLRMALPTLP